MATFESKSLSIIASGGLDTAPIIIPIQAFGRQNQRTLSNLPQQPNIKSAQRRRLIMSWWDHEISIWKIPMRRTKETGRESPLEADGPEGRKLVAKIALQGDEAITSADLSSDGHMLVVSTTAEVKCFSLRSKIGGLKVQKIEVPSRISKNGARLVQISPNTNWLATVRPDNNIVLHRVIKGDNPKKGPILCDKTLTLKRLKRDSTQTKYQYGTLGAYERFINRLAFSADGRILVVGDISGYLDTWVLEGHEDMTQEDQTRPDSVTKIESSDDEDDEDTEIHPNVIFGQHWIRNPSASLLIKLPAAPLILSFRPVAMQPTPALTNGNIGLHPTRHTPHPHSHDLPIVEDRLFVLTAENQMYEFNILSGRITDWSRRNPTSGLPQEFKDTKDRAMGAVWDLHGQNERIWLYGVSWIWMFDLLRDIQPLDQAQSKPPVNGNEVAKQHKRKRAHDSEDDYLRTRSRPETGAGSEIPISKIGVGIGAKIRRIEGDDNENAKAVPFERNQKPSSASDDDDDYILANETSLVLRNLRRSDRADDVGVEDESVVAGETSMEGEGAAHVTKVRPSHWHTFKYRPILGIVPLGGEGDDEARGDAEDSPPGLEVALVERPLWDLDLPPQYYGNQEWDT